jgi:biotin--protein ligase
MHWTVCSMSALGAGDGNGDSTSSGSSDKVQVYCASERERQKLLASILPEDMVILGLSGPADREVGAGSVAAYTGPDAVMPSSPDAPFDAARFHALLAAKQSLLLGQTLLHAPLIPSTQDMLFATLRAPPDGLVCVADIQTKGKGRGSNAWMSPPGCLCFSFAWGLNNAALLPFFQYIVSMALYRAVSTAIGGDAYQRAGLRLKWPNDIYILGSKSGSTTAATKTKIGGVLCQSTVAAGGGAGCKPFRIVAGVGINVLNSEPSCCLRDVLEANGHQEAAAAMSRERLLASFCVHFEELAQVLEAKGFEPLVSEYTSQWMHSGQSVEVQIEDKSKCAHEAVIVGLSSSGYLRARDTASGAELELHPDGNSLDMMQGLIYTKR